MRRSLKLKDWSIGSKIMASHLLLSVSAVLIATLLFNHYSFEYTKNNVMEELQRQATIIAQREGRYVQDEPKMRGFSMELYQSLTNSVVFCVDTDGEAIQLQRYVPSGNEAYKPRSAIIADAEPPTLPDASAEPALIPPVQPLIENVDAEPPFETTEATFHNIELFDNVDKAFIERVLNGETITGMQRFAFAEGIIIFAGAPIYNSADEIIGAIILAQPIEIMHMIGKELRLMQFTIAGFSILLAAALALAQTHMLVKPVEILTRVARKMAEGDYSHRVEAPSKDEIGELGMTLNALSGRLSEIIESLREERNRLELIIGSIGEGILAVDQDMQVLHHNAAFLELMELDTIDSIHHSDRSDVAALLSFLRNGENSHERRRFEWKNPSNRSIQAQTSTVRDENGEQVGVVCLLSDVSEAQRLEQLRRDYVANISHELRTPLTGIRGMIEPLMDGYVDTESERQNCYTVIHDETIRLEKLVGEMLDMSRLQDGRITVELERMELPGILQAAVRSMQNLADEAKVELALEIGSSKLECLGNEDRIKQVLVVLLDNAIDFTPPGGKVTLFAYERGAHIVVGVRDTGCGIEPKDLPFIWERFYKADRSRMRTKGTGLGLSIAKLVVENMGGEINVASQATQGSEFTFTLKRA